MRAQAVRTRERVPRAPPLTAPRARSIPSRGSFGKYVYLVAASKAGHLRKQDQRRGPAIPAAACVSAVLSRGPWCGARERMLRARIRGDFRSGSGIAARFFRPERTGGEGAELGEVLGRGRLVEVPDAGEWCEGPIKRSRPRIVNRSIGRAPGHPSRAIRGAAEVSDHAARLDLGAPIQVQGLALGRVAWPTSTALSSRAPGRGGGSFTRPPVRRA